MDLLQLGLNPCMQQVLNTKVKCLVPQILKRHLDLLAENDNLCHSTFETIHLSCRMLRMFFRCGSAETTWTDYWMRRRAQRPVGRRRLLPPHPAAAPVTRSERTVAVRMVSWWMEISCKDELQHLLLLTAWWSSNTSFSISSIVLMIFMINRTIHFWSLAIIF